MNSTSHRKVETNISTSRRLPGILLKFNQIYSTYDIDCAHNDYCIYEIENIFINTIDYAIHLFLQ